MTDEWWTRLKSITLNAGTEAPQLWPDGADEDYAAARLALLEAEQALRDQRAALSKMRRSLPRGAVLPEYDLTEGPRDLELDGPEQQVTLQELFGDHDTLVVYHFMFHPEDDEACPLCSLWIDGLHGVSHHLTRRTAFAVIGKAPVVKLRGWARRRGWDGLRIVSSYGTSFNPDLHVEGPKGGQWPAVSVFVRDGDGVRHVFTECARYPDGAEGGMDQLSPVWNAFDLLPEGRGDWLPDNAYPGRSRGS
jgi:predicted dithiol-disulfide oxidoreductase (DUF899 family)